MYAENIKKKKNFGNNRPECMHTITQCWPASSQIANLFIEISDYNTQTATNKYISEDSLTNYYVTLHIGTQNYFDLVFLTRKKETEPAGSRTFRN